MHEILAPLAATTKRTSPCMTEKVVKHGPNLDPRFARICQLVTTPHLHERFEGVYPRGFTRGPSNIKLWSLPRAVSRREARVSCESG